MHAVDLELLDRFALHVRLGVEIAKQQYERDHVTDQRVVHPEREFTARNDAVDTEHHGDGELDQLQNRQNEEECVREFQHLGEVIPPDGIHNLQTEEDTETV
uniref:Uncharacterized protein n=1 Tax=Anopheles culicifacies TaxID=139723 RepID=A0A182M1V3_9DIPT